MALAQEHLLLMLPIRKMKQLVICIGLKRKNPVNILKNFNSKHSLFHTVIQQTVRILIEIFHTISFDLQIELCAWPLGTYKVVGQICNGDCGSHHAHTSVYDTATSSFELTKKP